MECTYCSCKGCKNQMCTNRIPLFSALSHEEMDQIQSLIIQRRYQKGESIVYPNQPMHCLFILNEGVVKVTRESYEHKEHILYLLSEHEFFGETSLFANIPSMISASALTDTVLCTISKADFQGLIVKYPSIALKVLEELSIRLNKLENMLENTGGKTIDERLVQLLGDFSLKYGEVQEQGTLISLQLNREEIANYLGLSRETVSRKLAKLHKQGDLKVIGHKKILLYHKKVSSN
jgi:CRP-like cAMP-binding protein